MPRALARLPLHTTALAFVSFGIVLVQVQVLSGLSSPNIFGLLRSGRDLGVPKDLEVMVQIREHV